MLLKRSFQLTLEYFRKLGKLLKHRLENRFVATVHWLLVGRISDVLQQCSCFFPLSSESAFLRRFKLLRHIDCDDFTPLVKAALSPGQPPVNRTMPHRRNLLIVFSFKKSQPRRFGTNHVTLVSSDSYGQLPKMQVPRMHFIHRSLFPDRTPLQSFSIDCLSRVQYRT